MNKLIKEIIRNNKIKIVSFDIFDTLIYRTTLNPEGVFSRMFEEYPKKFPSFSEADDFVNARKYAEISARNDMERRTGNREVNLDDIYSFLPPVYNDNSQIAELEVETECKCAIKNEQIWSLIQELKEMGVRLILISDMYLSLEQIKRILVSAGIEVSFFDKIYISNELGCDKSSGKLFNLVLEQENILSSELLHIGDNYYGDIGASNRLNIMNYHYASISNGKYKFPYLLMEDQIYRNKNSFSLKSMRLLAANTNSEGDPWFEMGAMIMGPFLSLATEWILDIAEKNDIQDISPLMREGKFISELLERASKYRTTNFTITPMYISRLSVSIASLDRAEASLVENILSTCNMRVKDAFRILGIEDLIGDLKRFKDTYLNDLTVEVIDGELVKDLLIQRLCSDEMLHVIRERNKNNSKNLFLYLDKLKLVNNKAITVDFGWRGSIQYEIDKNIEKNSYDSKLMHLLLISKPEAVVNVKRGTTIRGFLGNWGSREYEILAIFARFLELFFYCEEGTTIGYNNKNGSIEPITETINYSEMQRRAMLRVQAGVRAFQDIYLVNKLRHPEITIENEDIKQEAINSVLRLCAFPTSKEAELLGELEYDQNFGANVLTKIISKEDIENRRDKGFDDYFAFVSGTGANWFSGINAICEPGIYAKNVFLLNRKYKYISLLSLAEKSLTYSNDRPIIIIGAGENGKMLITLFSLLGKKQPISIIDNNPNIDNSNIGGIIIRRPNDQSLTNDAFYVFSVMVKNVYEALKKQIFDCIGDYEYISYFDGELK